MKMMETHKIFDIKQDDDKYRHDFDKFYQYMYRYVES